MSQKRELFASRIGFILMTAGCAIGLGNIWRFPYITGQYGGGLFVLLYLFFLIVLGWPVMLMELALGRAGRSTYPGAFRNLHSGRGGRPWYSWATVLFSGNFLLLMFYVPVTGWLLAYSFFAAEGFSEKAGGDSGKLFNDFTSGWEMQTVCMVIALLITFCVCTGGVRKSVEKSVKYMMGGLFLLLAVLVVKALTLENAMKGVEFFLRPSLDSFAHNGVWETVSAAMSQAFFTLSLGIGSIAVCGSYIDKTRSLPMEGVVIIILDSIVSICAGLIIFPACGAYNIAPDAGPGLIFVTLPNVFMNMAGGRFWGTLFFVFLAIAALSTLVAVFENVVAYGIDEFNWSRKKSCMIFGGALLFLCMPCILGFNLWKEITFLGKDIQGFEDFLVSDNLLPLGAFTLVLFCSWRFGWGMKNFYLEVNTGKGWKLTQVLVPYMKYVLPVIILALWGIRLWDFIGK